MASLVSRLRRAAAAASALLAARAQFAIAELGLAASHAAAWLLMAMLVWLLALLSICALTAAVVLALWDRFGWYSAGVLGLLYAACAGWLALRLLRQIRASPKLLAQTFAELAKDREVLFGPRSGAPGSEP